MEFLTIAALSGSVVSGVVNLIKLYIYKKNGQILCSRSSEYKLLKK